MHIIDSYDNVSLYTTLDGLYVIKVNEVEVWSGTSRFQADDIFGHYIDD